MSGFDYIIAGGGAAGLMIAYRMSLDPYFDDKSIAVIDKKVQVTNDRTWCFWETDGGEWDHLVEKKWDQAYFGSPSFSKILNLAPLQYKMIRSKSFYTFLTTQIERKRNFSFIFSDIEEIKEKSSFIKVKTAGEELTASKVLSSLLDTNLLTQQSKYPYLQQHFIGWFVKTEYPVFDPYTVTFMDFNIPQRDNTRFMYLLPISANEALIEYTLFSDKLLSKEEYEDGIKDYLVRLNPGAYRIVDREYGNIPMTTYPFQKRNTRNLLHIGTAGGWTKASTGYTFYNCSVKTRELILFLKTGRALNKFPQSDRFQWYDKVFLSVLQKENHLGSEIFSHIFKKMNPVKIFRFLCEESSLIDEIAIMNTVPKRKFMKAALRSILK